MHLEIVHQKILKKIMMKLIGGIKKVLQIVNRNDIV